MRARIAVGAALAGIAIALTMTGPVVAAPAPTEPADEVFVEVNPSTIEAGERVGIRASCPENNRDATVRSDAFGRVTVEPRFGFLSRSVRVPATQDPRSFTVRLTCPGGETATATLHVVDRTRPSRGPATGFGGSAGSSGSAGAGFGLLAVGLLMVAAGTVVGIGAMARRRRNA